MLFQFFRKKKQANSGNTAKARLNNVLMADRLKVSPEVMNQIKKRIQESVGQYVEIDINDIEMQVEQKSSGVTLSTKLAIKEIKKKR
ncbi:MAG: cell division topological specificity factor MinE [Clostridia bacterium]